MHGLHGCSTIGHKNHFGNNKNLIDFVCKSQMKPIKKEFTRFESLGEYIRAVAAILLLKMFENEINLMNERVIGRRGKGGRNQWILLN